MNAPELARWVRHRIPGGSRLLRRRWPLWVPPGHFYSPIPDPAEVAADAARLYSDPASLPAIDLGLDAQMALVEQLAALAADFPFPEHEAAGWRYHFGNTLYPYGDGIFYFALLRHLRPRRVVEVGSGFSSVLALETSERFLEGTIDFTFVEPYPEVLERLATGSSTSFSLRRERVQDVPLEVFASLDRGDVLFVDSTHVAKTGSDVNRILFEVLPALRPGVWIHFHDVHYPFEYPRPWVDEGRAWNEAYALRAFLQYNSAFEVRLFNTQLRKAAPEVFARAFPHYDRHPGGSIWIEKTAP